MQKEKIDNFNFYPRVIKENDILFANEVQTQLNKGLQYNLGHKHKHWIRNLALESLKYKLKKKVVLTYTYN